MPELRQCEFYLLRYVPDAVKAEFVNIGVLLVEQGAGEEGRFAGLRFTSDWQRVRCLDPAADLEMLEALEADLRRELQQAGSGKFLSRLQDSFSNVLQLSSAKACLTESPQDEIAELARMYLERGRVAGERAAAGRQRIVNTMRSAFEQAGVWKMMRKRIPVAEYTHKGDPLKIDCGYRPNGVLKMFHAVSLTADVDAAKVLAFTYPQIADGLARSQGLKSALTAVVEDDPDRGAELIAFALDTLQAAQISVVSVAEMPSVAELARRDLKM
jgi:hypothetical protein